jgi:cytochrome c-type biogenesis protein CcmF
VFVPLMVPVLLLMAVGPFVRWKEAALVDVLRRLRPVALATVLLVGAAAIVLRPSIMVTLGLTCAAWILLATGFHLLQRLRHGVAGASLWKRVKSQPRSYWGMLVAHAGIAIFVIGVTLVKGLDSVSDVTMRVGDVSSIGGYAFRFADLEEIKGPNYIAARGTFEVTYEGAKVSTMVAEKRMYIVQKMPMTEAGIERGFTRDLYVSLGEATDDGKWVIRLQHKPFVGWIWGGCLIIAFGGLLAAMDRRYRMGSRSRKAGLAEVASAPLAAGPALPSLLVGG